MFQEKNHTWKKIHKDKLNFIMYQGNTNENNSVITHPPEPPHLEKWPYQAWGRGAMLNAYGVRGHVTWLHLFKNSWLCSKARLWPRGPWSGSMARILPGFVRQSHSHKARSPERQTETRSNNRKLYSSKFWQTTVWKTVRMNLENLILNSRNKTWKRTFCLIFFM
jgi:hypothetical protein